MRTALERAGAGYDRDRQIVAEPDRAYFDGRRGGWGGVHRQSPRFGATIMAEAAGSTLFRANTAREYQGCAGEVARRSVARGHSLHRGERRRDQQLAYDLGDDLAVLLGFCTRGDPVLIALERGPLLLAVGEQLPGEEIGQFLVRFADQRGEEAGLLDAVLFPKSSS